MIIMLNQNLHFPNSDGTFFKVQPVTSLVGVCSVKGKRKKREKTISKVSHEKECGRPGKRDSFLSLILAFAFALVSYCHYNK